MIRRRGYSWEQEGGEVVVRKKEEDYQQEKYWKNRKEKREKVGRFRKVVNDKYSRH